MRLIAVILVPLASGVLTAGQGGIPPTFRTATSAVLINVSVTRGNAPVSGLGANDFVLRDNGVLQSVTAVSAEAVAVDVTVFADTSSSTAGAHENLHRATREMLAVLRPGDRLRLLTFGLSVEQPMGWTPAGGDVPPFTLVPIGQVSLIYDALVAASVHDPGSGRAHVVIALTDGVEACSITTRRALQRLAGMTNAVFHWVPIGGFAPRKGSQARMARCDLAVLDTRPLEELVRGTGGVVHRGRLGGLFGSNPAGAFRQVLEDYRHSYLLQYTPEGVAGDGWHRVDVEVPSRDYTVRAKGGYFSNTPDRGSP